MRSSSGARRRGFRRSRAETGSKTSVGLRLRAGGVGRRRFVAPRRPEPSPSWRRYPTLANRRQGRPCHRDAPQLFTGGGTVLDTAGRSRDVERASLRSSPAATHPALLRLRTATGNATAFRATRFEAPATFGERQGPGGARRRCREPRLSGWVARESLAIRDAPCLSARVAKRARARVGAARSSRPWITRAA